jgi:hypothetical protein
MSIPVAIAELQDATRERRWAYLVTVGDDLRPHIVAVEPTWHDGRLVVDAGRRTAHNAGRRAAVTLCYPPCDASDHSLVVDGTARIEPAENANRLRFTPESAVLHRPAGPTGG